MEFNTFNEFWGIGLGRTCFTDYEAQRAEKVWDASAKCSEKKMRTEIGLLISKFDTPPGVKVVPPSLEWLVKELQQLILTPRRIS